MSEQEQASEYEFSEAENVVIDDLARKMKLVSFPIVGLGTLGFFVALFQMKSISTIVTMVPEHYRSLIWVNVVMGMLMLTSMLFVGFWLYNSSRSFVEIVRTEGSDVTHLMTALSELKKPFVLLFWAFLALIALLLGGVARVLLG